MDFSEKIIGKEKYFNSAVIVLIVQLEGEKSILFQKRAKKIRQGGDISFPGGKIEENETSLEASLRECHEEIGIDSSKIKVLGKVGTVIIPSSVLVEAFLGETKIESFEELKINHDEVEEVFFVPIEELKNMEPKIEKLKLEVKPEFELEGVDYIFPAKELKLPKMYHKPWSSIREVYMYTYDNKVIWGITAEILKEVIKYLKNEDKG